MDRFYLSSPSRGLLGVPPARPDTPRLDSSLLQRFWSATLFLHHLRNCRRVPSRELVRAPCVTLSSLNVSASTILLDYSILNFSHLVVWMWVVTDWGLPLKVSLDMWLQILDTFYS